MPSSCCTVQTADMLDVLGDLVRWMGSLDPVWVYAILLGIAYGENLLPPVPGDMVVVFGGYLAGVGRLDAVAVTLVATLGGLAGFMTMYAIGLRMGDLLLAPDRLTWLPKGKIEVARVALARRGYVLVAANRFLSGMRSVISLTVGMTRMPSGPVAVLAFLSSLVWTALLVAAGYVVGDRWEIVGGWLKAWGSVILGIAALFVVVQIVYYVRRRRPGSGHVGQPGGTAGT